MKKTRKIHNPITGKDYEIREHSLKYKKGDVKSSISIPQWSDFNL